MKLSTAFPSTPPDRPDHSTVEAVSQRLLESSEALAGMTEAVASARQVKEYDSERRRRDLAIVVREFLLAGDSASAAETKGRSSALYGEQLDKRAAELLTAERVLSQWEATMTQWRSAQSVLSSLKTIAANV